MKFYAIPKFFLSFFSLVILFFFFNSTFLFAGLFSDSIVMLTPKKHCKMKRLKTGNLILASDNRLKKHKSPYSNISGITIHKNHCKMGALLILQSNKGLISSILVGKNQKFFVLGKGVPTKKQDPWVAAKDLQKGFLLQGYGKTNLVVKDVSFIRFKRNIDLYEMSLKSIHTFYLVDSCGNCILTHNLFGSTALTIIALGALTGAVVGGTYTTYKAYSKDVLTAGTVVKGVLLGTLIGGTATAILYYGIYFGGSHILDAVTALRNAGANPAQAYEAMAFLNANASAIYFMGTTCATTAAGAGILLKESMDDYIDETARRENEDINFSGKDFEAGDSLELTIPGKNGEKDKVFKIVRKK